VSLDAVRCRLASFRDAITHALSSQLNAKLVGRKGKLSRALGRCDQAVNAAQTAQRHGVKRRIDKRFNALENQLQRLILQVDRGSATDCSRLRCETSWRLWRPRLRARRALTDVAALA